jgi:hypothetical protein
MDSKLLSAIRRGEKRAKQIALIAQQDRERTERKAARAKRKREGAEVRRAKKIIAAIPRIIEQNTAQGQLSEWLNYPFYSRHRKNFTEGQRMLYDYCLEAGLRPKVECFFQETPSLCHFLKISWY